MTDDCCSPSAGRAPLAAPTPANASDRPAAPPRRLPGMVHIPAGPFLMGGTDPDGFPADGEGPVREVHVGDFQIDATAVTTRRFGQFVRATGYVTEAERYGWSFVFDGVVHPSARRHIRPGMVRAAPWWRGVDGADWRHPEGPGSDIEMRADHPVVHVSHADAMAYAAWAGKRLPTEAEWEKAARGGLEQARYAWGSELSPGGRHVLNIWQGQFPTHNTGADGYITTAPVKTFPPNGYGLYNVSGNTWEWCADWFSPDWHLEARPETRRDPKGPAGGDGRVMRGGSYLCHDSYCTRYRVAARTSSTPDSTTGHLGFRCAADL